MGAPLRILAIDDEPSVTLSLIDVTSDPYDVIIVDQKMPDLTGIELVEAIRKRGISGKIIVVSAYLSDEVREAYERLDVHVMFPKPFNIDQLRSAVDRITA